jgi:hypothetical protein
MAVVRKHKGDKTKVNAKGVLVITRKNGTVVKINGPKGTIVRKKADGTVVKQKASTRKGFFGGEKANNFTVGANTIIKSQNVKKELVKRGGR